MGTCYNVVSGVGIVLDLDREEFYPERMVSSCDHPERAGQTFCPTCGVKVKPDTPKRETPEFVWTLEEVIMEIENFASEDGFQIGAVGYNRRLHFLGWGDTTDPKYSENDEIVGKDIPDVEIIKAWIADTLTRIHAGMADQETGEFEEGFEAYWAAITPKIIEPKFYLATHIS